MLKEFAVRSELSNWFTRGLGEKRTVVVPNPVNVANAARVAELDERIKRCVPVLLLYLSSLSNHLTQMNPDLPCYLVRRLQR